MDKKEAKDLCLEVWTYLRDNSEIRFKDALPDSIFLKIKDIDCKCPLCGVFNGCSVHGDDSLPPDNDCPLFPCVYAGGLEELYKDKFCSNPRTFERWEVTGEKDEEIRKVEAQAIIDLVSAWEV